MRQSHKFPAHKFLYSLMGCTALVATSILSDAVAQVPPPITVTIDVIAKDGDLESQLGGTFLLGSPGAGTPAFDLPLIDNSGKVYFFGNSDDGLGNFDSRTAGIWSGTGGAPTLIILEDIVLPQFTPLAGECAAGSATCGEIFHINPVFSVTPAGEITVEVSRDDLLRSRAILAGNRFDNLAPLVTDAQSSAPFIFGFGNSDFFANDNGTRVIGTLFGKDPFGTPNTGLSDFAAGLIGAEAPGIPGVNITKILGSSVDRGSIVFGLNNQDDLLFAAKLDDGGTALYLSPGQGSIAFSLIARSGDAAPGIPGAELIVSSGRINDAGQGLFEGGWATPNASGARRNILRNALWRFDASGNLTLVVSEFVRPRSGDPITEPVYVTTEGARTAFRAGSPSTGLFISRLSPDGDVYFLALGEQIDARGLPIDNGVWGLWKAPAGGGMIELVLKQHMNQPGSAPDTPGTILPDGSEVFSLTNSTITFDADGSLIITIRTREAGSFKKALYAEDSTGILQRVIGEGDMIEVAPDVFREVQDFNFGTSSLVGSASASFRNDRIALSVTFTDNSNAILRARFVGGTLEVTDFIWSGACDDTNWHGTCNDSNWNNAADRFPAEKSPGDAAGTENVVIADADVVISDRAVHLDSLSATGSLEVNQALTLEGASTIEDLALKADLVANAALSLTGINNVWSDGAISGNGTVTVDNGAMLTISPANGSLDLKTTLKILGEAKQTGGTLNLTGGGKIVINGGEYKLDEGGMITGNGSSVKLVLQNSGKFTQLKDSSGTIDVPIESDDGFIKILDDSRLLIKQTGNWKNTQFILKEGSRLTFNGPQIFGAGTSTIKAPMIEAPGPNPLSKITFNDKITVLDNGVLAIQGSRVIFEGDIDVTQGTLKIEKLSKDILWQSGSITGGIFNDANNIDFGLVNLGELKMSGIIPSGGFRLDGVLDNGGKFIISHSLNLGDQAVLANRGVLAIEGDSAIRADLGATALLNNTDRIEKFGSGAADIWVELRNIGTDGSGNTATITVGNVASLTLHNNNDFFGPNFLSSGRNAMIEFDHGGKVTTIHDRTDIISDGIVKFTAGNVLIKNNAKLVNSIHNSG